MNLRSSLHPSVQTKSEDVWKIRVSPVEVSTLVDPVCGSSVMVIALLEPSEKRTGRHFGSTLRTLKYQFNLNIKTSLKNAFSAKTTPIKKKCCHVKKQFFVQKIHHYIIHNRFFSHLVDHSASSLARSLLAALCFSSSLSFSLLAVSGIYEKLLIGISKNLMDNNRMA